jgi:hypothetical protein
MHDKILTIDFDTALISQTKFIDFDTITPNGRLGFCQHKSEIGT